MNRSACYEQAEISLRILTRWIKEKLSDPDLDITLSQYHILAYLDQVESTTVSQLAQYLRVTSSAVTTMIDRLFRMDLVIRERDHEDRRVVTLRLSEDGKSVVDAFRKKQESIYTELFADLDDEELRQLTALLQKVTSTLDNRADT